MNELRGFRLVVYVSAAEARRRLRGFGHGVRKIHSGGRNQAVIIHTATGQHLRELQNKFADVGCAEGTAPGEEPIANLRNLGPASAEWLRDVGIRTIADLRQWGAVAAFLQVRARFPQASWNLLWGLAAGLEDRDWRSLSPEEKSSLRQQVASLQ